MTLTKGQLLKRRMIMPRKFIRTMDALGRIVLPQEFRSEMCWKDGTRFSIIRDRNKLILQEDNDFCFLEETDKKESL